MHTKELKVFCIAQTRLNQEATRQWLDHIGASETPVPVVRKQDMQCHDCEGRGRHDNLGPYCSTCQGHGTLPNVEPEITDAGAVCGICAKRCYMSFEPGLNPNISKVRKDWFDYLSNILESRHGSVTEHATWTFAIEGVSRVFTGEMNRHRAGVAISEGSMRYIRFDDIGMWMPKSLEPGDDSLMPTRKCKTCDGSGKLLMSLDDCPKCLGSGRINLLSPAEFEGNKYQTQHLIRQTFHDIEEKYRALCEIWDMENLKSFDVKKKLTSLFRRIIPMGTSTGGCWTFNTRALRHIIALRTDPAAEEEIAHVVGLIGKWIIESEPALFGDFAIDDKTGAYVPRWVKV